MQLDNERQWVQKELAESLLKQGNPKSEEYKIVEKYITRNTDRQY